MLKSFALALAELGDPRIRSVLFKTAFGTLLIIILLWIMVGALLASFGPSGAWLHWIVIILGHLATGVLVWILFPSVSGLVMSLFLDEVARAVEARRYPALAPPPRQPLSLFLLAGLRFAGASLLLNLLALPLYLFLPGINLLFFYGLNGYLMSREYFELVALRRVAAEEARRVRLAHPVEMMVSGLAIAFLLTIPVVNLVAPLFATALMVHLFQGYARPSTAAGWA
jgi:CysZ protein